MYWNMARRDSPDGKLVLFIITIRKLFCSFSKFIYIVIIQDIGISIGAFYFKLPDNTYTFFKHMGRSNISYSMSVPTTDEEINFDNLHLKTVSQYSRMYSGFKIVSTYDDTYVAVSHNSFISIYSVESSTWVNHLYFPDQEVIGLFSRSTVYNSTITVDALTKDNKLYYDVLADIQRVDPFTEASQTIEGDLMNKYQDIDGEESYTM